jgi:hypothetical protein
MARATNVCTATAMAATTASRTSGSNVTIRAYDRYDNKKRQTESGRLYCFLIFHPTTPFFKLHNFSA